VETGVLVAEQDLVMALVLVATTHHPIMMDRQQVPATSVVEVLLLHPLVHLHPLINPVAMEEPQDDSVYKLPLSFFPFENLLSC